jgi:hypothetical protein
MSMNEAQATFEDVVLSRLTAAMAEDKARLFIQETLLRAGLEGLRSAGELLLFSDQLVTQGGFAEVVGRSLRVYAILSGASRSASAQVAVFPPSLIAKKP